jgi:hypothetical protein
MKKLAADRALEQTSFFMPATLPGSPDRREM